MLVGNAMIPRMDVSWLGVLRYVYMKIRTLAKKVMVCKKSCYESSAWVVLIVAAWCKHCDGQLLHQRWTITVDAKEKSNGWGHNAQKQKRYPPEFLPCRSKQPLESMFTFSECLTLVSLCPMRNKSMILLSKQHRDCVVNQPTKKPEVIEVCNATKEEVIRLISSATLTHVAFNEKLAGGLLPSSTKCWMWLASMCFSSSNSGVQIGMREKVSSPFVWPDCINCTCKAQSNILWWTKSQGSNCSCSSLLCSQENNRRNPQGNRGERPSPNN